MMATMIGVPVAVARVSAKPAITTTAVTLVMTVTALGGAGTLVRSSANSVLVASLAILTILSGCALLIISSRCASAIRMPNKPAPMKSQAVLQRFTLRSGHAALLSLLAGLSSGTLARFQLFSICSGASGTLSISQWVMPLTAVGVLALVAERSGTAPTLATLFAIRAAVLALLVVFATNPFASFVTVPFFLVLDCVTIPTLTNAAGKHRRVALAACPGAVHHVGGVLGAALSTMPYFFDDGFVFLFLGNAGLSAACAAWLITAREESSAGTSRCNSTSPGSPSAYEPLCSEPKTR
jgi:hypothetical protein